MSQEQTLNISQETYDLLQEVKKVFASYTGDAIEEFSDDKVVEILASGFFDTEEDDGGCANGSCGCHDEKGDKEGCGCGGHHHH